MTRDEYINRFKAVNLIITEQGATVDALIAATAERLETLDIPMPRCAEERRRTFMKYYVIVAREMDTGQ